MLVTVGLDETRSSSHTTAFLRSWLLFFGGPCTDHGEGGPKKGSPSGRECMARANPKGSDRGGMVGSSMGWTIVIVGRLIGRPIFAERRAPSASTAAGRKGSGRERTCPTVPRDIRRCDPPMKDIPVDAALAAFVAK